MPQKHDIGQQKRKKGAAATPIAPTKPAKLAIDLVRRGLANPPILDGMTSRFTKSGD
ncbi:hypothetical protein ABC337_11485 [Arthrobacter sp. 1P04PC]|uniref:hypothetical protein n=1 Tax=unclassified Arthrobacter TaxID=235627 RepID=UPI0039A29440